MSNVLEYIKNGGKAPKPDKSSEKSRKRALETDDDDSEKGIDLKKKRCLESMEYPPPLPAFNSANLELSIFKHKSITGLDKQNSRFLFEGEGIIKSLCMEICYDRYKDYSLADLKLLQSLVLHDETLANWAYTYKFQNEFHHELTLTNEERAISIARLLVELFKILVGALFYDYRDDFSKVKIWLECLIHHRLNNIDLINELDKARDNAEYQRLKRSKKRPKLSRYLRVTQFL